MPLLLVERRALSRAGGTAAGLSLADRLARRGHRRPPGHAGRSVPPLPVPYDHELRQGLSQGSQPGEGHRRDQEDDGREKGIEQQEGGSASCWTTWDLPSAISRERASSTS